MIGVQDFIDVLENENAKYILCLQNAGVCGLSEFSEYLSSNCTLVNSFFDPNKGVIEVWLRNNYS